MPVGQQRVSPTTPFSVNLEENEGEAGLNPATKKLFGFNQTEEVKEATMPEEKSAEVVQASVPNLVIDSPKELWDVLGHIQLHLTTGDMDEVVDQVKVAFELWAQLRKDYTDEIVWNMVKGSGDQVKYIVQLSELAEVEPPSAAELLDMSSTQASTLINELKKKAGVKDDVAEDKPQGRRFGGGGSKFSGSGGGFRKSNVDKDAQGTVSDGQVGLLNKLRGERDMDEYDDEAFGEMSFNDADAEIKELIATPKARKSSGRSGGGFSRRSFTKR